MVVFSDDSTPSTVISLFSALYDLSANTFERASQVPATGSARNSNSSEDSLNSSQRCHKMQTALAYLFRPFCCSTNDSPVQTQLNNSPRINVVCISNSFYTLVLPIFLPVQYAEDRLLCYAYIKSTLSPRESNKECRTSREYRIEKRTPRPSVYKVQISAQKSVNQNEEKETEAKRKGKGVKALRYLIE